MMGPADGLALLGRPQPVGPIIRRRTSMMQSIARCLGALALACGLGAAALPAQAQQQQFVNVLTGGQAGVYYPLGVALSQIYAKAIPNAKATAQVTKASAENLNLLQAGRGELAFTLADALSDAWKGDAEAGFPKPLDKLRGLSATYNNYIQIVANADSGIKTLADLKGKRLSVGAAKSGTELNARAILKAAGLSYSDLGKVEYLPFGESVELMKNRQLDATLQSAGLGVASIRDLATAVKIVVIPVPADVVAKVGDPAYQPAVIPANTYTGQTADVATAAIPNFLVTHAGVSDDLAYQMTKALYDNLDTLYAAHNAAKVIKRENALKGMPLPLHPGAAKYYKEVGLMK
jgi:TRAP transporter TAXI family solute receptor